MDAEQIQKLRERLGETQAAFAERVGVRRATIVDWERGVKQPSPMAIKLLGMISGQPKRAAKRTTK
jgi:DNA-binding transcriptional regulator YiaG